MGLFLHRFTIVLVLASTLCLNNTQALAQAAKLTGVISDGGSGELLTGASIVLSGPDLTRTAASGLDGSYLISQLDDGPYTIEVSFMGYVTQSRAVTIAGDTRLAIRLQRDQSLITEVAITAAGRGTDAHARSLERYSPNVLNVISAKQIQLSPDITVANVIQRVSGLSVERNSNGDPQYAIVRGMDKRYNNTLVNGIKIPSPDNQNRFVPLDIFPAVFLERLEVYKSLAADMEADAIGGTVNMVMQSAPVRGRFFDFDFQTGGNLMNLDGDFITYDRSEVYRKSPAGRYGPRYEAVPGDFPTLQFEPKNRVLADILTSASYGQRFLNDRLGILLGASYQSSFRPNDNYFYNPTILGREGNPLRMNELIERRTSTEQQRMAFHAKLDYSPSANHTFSLYAGQYHLNEFRVREQHKQEGQFHTPTGFNVYPMTRVTNTFQTISIANLSAAHQLTERFSLDWQGVYSLAKNELPDDAIFMRTAKYDADTETIFDETPTTFTGSHNSRWWERNDDQDLSAYLNATYRPAGGAWLEQLKVGAMIRHKNRDNDMLYYRYTAPLNMFAVRGENWMYFGDIEFDPISGIANGYGDGNNSNLVYDADETITALYANSSWQFSRLHLQAGLRAEHTSQGYFVDNSNNNVPREDIEDRQDYLHLFPSLSLKYAVDDRSWLKSTYYKAISRPGFYEIVPTNRSSGGGDSFYHERGNPDLKPTIGHNIDIRYELFPNALDQILAGVFYKQLIDPIEYGFPLVDDADEAPSTSRILPQNFGTAHNFGVELDYTKYVREFGVRLNYTYTNSTISTNKIVENELPAGTTGSKFSIVDEKRPLQGQSDHVGNISLLYKNIRDQWDAQLVLNYTGKRLAVVSPYEGTDQYMRPMSVLDFSLEKGFGRTVLFLKANNLLNTPYQLIIDKPIGFSEDHYRHQEDPSRMGNIRRDLYGQSFRLGMRFKL